MLNYIQWLEQTEYRYNKKKTSWLPGRAVKHSKLDGYRFKGSHKLFSSFCNFSDTALCRGISVNPTICPFFQNSTNTFNDSILWIFDATLTNEANSVVMSNVSQNFWCYDNACPCFQMPQYLLQRAQKKSTLICVNTQQTNSYHTMQHQTIVS